MPKLTAFDTALTPGAAGEMASTNGDRPWEYGEILELLRRQPMSPPQSPFILETLARCERCGSIERRALEHAAGVFLAARGPRNGTAALLRAMRVAGILVKEFQADAPEVVAAALLHEVLEDGAGDVEEIERKFGENVTDFVVLLTPPRFFPKAQRERIYLGGLISAPEEVLMIKLAELREELQFQRSSRANRTHGPLLHLFEDVLGERQLQPATRAGIARVQREFQIRRSQATPAFSTGELRSAA